MKDRWFEAFRQEPEQAVSDLFTGRAGLGSAMRLGVPELLQQWFPPSLAEERVQLDDALLSWLRGMRDGYDAITRRIGFPVYGKRVGEALIALQLLDLPCAREAIRADLDAWLGWLKPLRLGSARDPGLECYRLLTHGQGDARHTALWLRLAADRRPEYLTVSLAGLRELPNGHDARKNQMLMVQALLRHAVVIHDDAHAARGFFNGRFAALRGFFPRGPQHWNGVLAEALERFVQIETPMAKQLVGALREELPGTGREVTVSVPTAKAMMTVLRERVPRAWPVGAAAWRAFARQIVNARPRSERPQGLFDVLEQNHRCALENGDSNPFVHTLGQFGDRLLDDCELGTDDMERVGVMVERGLAWAPGSPHCWALWAKWFRVRGQLSLQEAVLRESLRLSPCNAVAQVELARLLVDRGPECWAEADYHVKRAMAQDPDNRQVSAVRAELLTRRGRYRAAQTAPREVGRREPNSPKQVEVMDRLAGVYRAAESDVQPYEGIDPQQGRQAVDAAPVALPELLRRAGLAGEFIRARIARGAAVQTKLISQESRKGDALAGFYSQWLKLRDTPQCPPHAWAWSACLNWQGSAAADDWEELAKRFPEAASETRFLQALAGGRDASGAGMPGLHEAGSVLDRPVDAIMRDGQAMLDAADIDQADRDDLACALMACAAAAAPEFAPAG